jgi:hypothetical protein
MDSFTAIMIAERIEDASPDEQIKAWQMLVDTGLAWQLQGWFGKTANQLIQQGIIKGVPNA